MYQHQTLQKLTYTGSFGAIILILDNLAGQSRIIWWTIQDNLVDNPG